MGVVLGALMCCWMVMGEPCDEQMSNVLVAAVLRQRSRERCSWRMLSWSFGACNVAFGDGVKDGLKVHGWGGSSGFRVGHMPGVATLKMQ